MKVLVRAFSVIVKTNGSFAALIITVTAQCFPLYSLLTAAAGEDITVNYLSLDIEGAEFLVLQTIPWDKVARYTI